MFLFEAARNMIRDHPTRSHSDIPSAITLSTTRLNHCARFVGYRTCARITA
jgi:hypothetical protein